MWRTAPGHALLSACVVNHTAFPFERDEQINENTEQLRLPGNGGQI